MKAEQNITILYTSHDMSEITRICDEVIFLDHGKIVAHDTPLGLTKLIKNSELILTFNDNIEIAETYLIEKGIHFNRNNIQLSINAKQQDIPNIIYRLSNLGIAFKNIEMRHPTLDDVFLQIARDIS